MIGAFYLTFFVKCSNISYHTNESLFPCKLVVSFLKNDFFSFSNKINLRYVKWQCNSPHCDQRQSETIFLQFFFIPPLHCTLQSTTILDNFFTIFFIPPSHCNVRLNKVCFAKEKQFSSFSLDLRFSFLFILNSFHNNDKIVFYLISRVSGAFLFTQN